MKGLIKRTKYVKQKDLHRIMMNMEKSKPIPFALDEPKKQNVKPKNHDLDRF